MITGDLRNIDDHCDTNAYDLVFGNWALCYLNDVDVDPVLQKVNDIMKPEGVLVFKEPTTVTDRRDEYVCASHQGMIYRNGRRIRKYLQKRFDIKYQDFFYSSAYGTQNIYFAVKKEQ